MKEHMKKPDPKILMVDPRQIKRFGKNYRGYIKKERVIPFRKSFSVSHQTDLYFNPERGAKYHVGDYFELLAQCMYGGINQRTLEVRTLNPSPSSTITLFPDTLNLNESWAREIKGISSGNGLRLSDDKMLGYILLQLSTGIFKKPPKIFFEIFRYGPYGRGDHEKIEKSMGPMNLDEKLRFLSKNIRYQLSIPFSLLFQMYLSPKWLTPNFEKSLVYRCENNLNHEQSYPETKIKSQTLTRLLLDPKETMKEFKIDPSNFRIKHAKSPIIRVNGSKICDFPVLIVRDKVSTSSFVDHLRTLTKDPQEIFSHLFDDLHDTYHEEKISEASSLPLLQTSQEVKMSEKGDWPANWD